MSTEKLNVALAEYQALRSEINLKLQMFYQIYTIYFTALGFFYGYVVVNKILYFIVAVPFVALALFFRLLYDQRVIRLIGEYIKTSLSENQLPKIIAAASPDGCRDLPDVMQWEQYYRTNAPPRYYKASIFIIFVILSVVPPTAYNIHELTTYCIGPYHSALPIWAQWISLLANLAIGSWMGFRIIKDDY